MTAAPVLLRSLGALLVCVVSLTGCSREPPNARVIAERLVPDASGEFFSLADASSETVRFDWRMTDPAERHRWTMSTLDERSRPVDGGFRVVPGDNRPSLEREVDFEAAEIDRIDVEIIGAPRGFARLMWAGPGETFASERMIQVATGGNLTTVHSFDLARHPAWSGRIRHLRLLPTSSLKQPIVVAGLRGVALALDWEKLAALADLPLRMELDDEVRTAILLYPDRDWERTVVPPAGGVFEFFVGRPLWSEPVTLTVSAFPGTPEAQLLTSVALDDGGAWRRIEVDLSPWAGRTTELAIRLDGSGEAGAPDGIAFLSGPQILRPAYRHELPPDVVVILIDTLRADRVSINGYHRETTPNLDRWARTKAVNFTSAIAPSPWTLPSHVSLFTGQDAIVHGRNHDQGPPPAFDLLAEQLRRAGYTTQAVTGGGYLHPEFGFDQGFDSFRHWPSNRPQQEELVSGVEHALAALAELNDRPSFLFFHTYEVHSPFTEREPYFSAYAGDDVGDRRPVAHREPSSAATGFVETKTLRIADASGEHEFGESDRVYVDAFYDAGVSYTDLHIGRILERLETAETDRKTLVIVTSDHGEALGDRGLASHNYLYDFNLRIPLLISFPDAEAAGRTIERQVRLVDVLPTILDVIGAEPSTRVDGRSLRVLVADETAPFPSSAWSYAASTNFGLSLRFENRIKLITNDSIWQPVRGAEELYGLVEDPDEVHNRIEEGSQELDELRRVTSEKMAGAEGGLLITIDNLSKDLVSLRLGSVKPTRVKAISVSARTVVDGDATSPRIRVEAGDRATLRLETPDLTRPLEIDAQYPDDPGVCSFTVDLGGIRDAVTFCASRACCGQPSDDDAAQAVRLSITPLGDVAVDESPAPSSIDEDLREKLEALGYVQTP